MRGSPTTTDRLVKAIADAVLLLPLAVVNTWEQGRAKAKPPAEPEPRLEGLRITTPEEAEPNVADWVREYEARRGRKPKIAEVQDAFGLSKTTAWRRIKSA